MVAETGSAFRPLPIFATKATQSPAELRKTAQPRASLPMVPPSAARYFQAHAPSQH
jgi:hypothetical protein